MSDKFKQRQEERERQREELAMQPKEFWEERLAKAKARPRREFVFKAGSELDIDEVIVNSPHDSKHSAW